MKQRLTLLCAFLLLPLFAWSADSGEASSASSGQRIVWTDGMDVELFWQAYAESNGGLTWGASTAYPKYEEVKEGDTLLIKVEQGPCLMEFYHSRWRRANDVRRWADSMNGYGGCENVFD